MIDIPIPKELRKSVDDIHSEMLGKAPKDITTIEGDFFWDTTRPSAEQSARTREIALQNVLKMAFPQSSTGKYLEYLGEFKCIYKNKATPSTGKVKVKGRVGNIVPIDTIFSTVATSEKEPIEYKSLEEITIDSSETAIINIECLIPGTIGNVQANSITILMSSISGISLITNEQATKGGTDIEDEEHYRERVLNAEKEENLSGADSDYIKWAKEVDGVGYAYCIEEWNGPGTVKVPILDKNGQPATQILINNVQQYICPDKKEGENRGGKAPIGAIVTVSTPDTLEINVSAKFIISTNFSLELILEKLKEEISYYLKTIKLNGIVKYNSIYSIVGQYILNNEGIEDFEGLMVNGDVKNIILTDQVAVVGKVSNAND